MTLHRWSEGECGDSNGTAIVRDEETGKAYREVHPQTGKSYRYAIADREKGAWNRVRKIVKDVEATKGQELSFYHQTDPRGASLYVSNETLTDSNYSSRGIAIY